MKITVNVDGISYDVDIANLYERPVIARVDGVQFEIWPEGEAPYRSKATGINDSVQAIKGKNGSRNHRITAPISGIIESIAIQPGDEVAVGQELCFLEAMKMKNVIRASQDGRIGEIKVHRGQQVATGEVLMLYEL